MSDKKKLDIEFLSVDGKEANKSGLDLVDELDILSGQSVEVQTKVNQEESFRLDFNEESEQLIQQLTSAIPKIEEEIKIPSYRDLLAETRARITNLKNEKKDYKPGKIGFDHVENPEDLILKLEQVGYHCAPYLAAQLSLLLTCETDMVRSVLLEGAPGVGKSYMAKCLAKISGAEFMVLSCYNGMNLQHLIEKPSALGVAKIMAGMEEADASKLMNLGIISRAFLKSQERPVIVLIDELDKVDDSIDTFFLGPLQDATVYLESGQAIAANKDNLLIVFTKNYERQINDALLRRVQPITLDFLEASLERKILEPHCLPQIIDNLVRIADVMRYSDSAYKFDRPPAPEELLKIGRYIMRLLEWDIIDYSFVGKNVWQLFSKSENDRYVLELMLRYHPDFFDSLRPQGRLLTKIEVFSKLGRLVLKNVIPDPEETARKKAYRAEKIGLVNIGTPQELISKLEEVRYECPPFLANQMCLLLNTPTEKVRSVLLEGPPGCGKSYLAKSIAKITGADFMVLSCYTGMNLQHLIEAPSAYAIASATAGESKEELMSLGIISRAFLKSKNQPVVLLVDEIDKVDVAIDTFFLGPLQDATVYLESRAPIDANIDNLLVVLTKNYVRVLNDALLRRVHPVKLTYLNANLERKILRTVCSDELTENLITIVDRMRFTGGSFGFDRPPAPEELVTIANYINKMLSWGEKDFINIAKNVFAIIAKSERDRAVLEHMMRFHPDYLDPLTPDGKNMTMDQVYGKLGRILLKGIISDPDAKKRERAWDNMDYS